MTAAPQSPGPVDEAAPGADTRVESSPSFSAPRVSGLREWRCDLHGAVTHGDCPCCDDELIALAEETAHDERPACFYCRRGMHSACMSGEFPCRCCDGADAATVVAS